MREAVEILTDQLDEHKAHLDHALTNRAIVRYDAFRDAGGEQSASFALLDSYRSGVVFSAIAARDFARIYVKHLHEGVADRDLSPEEEQAVIAAVPRPLAAGEAGPRSARAPRLADQERPTLGRRAADQEHGTPRGVAAGCRRRPLAGRHRRDHGGARAAGSAFTGVGRRGGATRRRLFYLGRPRVRARRSRRAAPQCRAPRRAAPRRLTLRQLLTSRRSVRLPTPASISARSASDSLV